jgi:hypothetical protein
MTLREARVLFTKLVGQLLVQIDQTDWSRYGKVEVAVDEWTVHSNRIYIDNATGQRRFGVDRIHHPKGFHPRGLALDLLVYINGAYITSGSHPIWRDLDIMAHKLHPELNFGDEFHDSNHLSLGEVKR